MLFHIVYEVSPDKRDATQERFKKTGGMPPAEVKMLGRWHSLQGHIGFALVEASDPQAIASWLQGWTDLMEFQLTPVLTDDQFTQILG